MINASLNIAWSIAEIETAAAGFGAIMPNHFWIGCCKGSDIDKIISQLNQRLAERRITLALGSSAYDLLLREGFNKEYGAREMERTVERLIARPLAEGILHGDFVAGRRLMEVGKDLRIQWKQTG